MFNMVMMMTMVLRLESLAIAPDVAEKAVAKVLMRRGFTKDNTLFGHST